MRTKDPDQAKGLPKGKGSSKIATAFGIFYVATCLIILGLLFASDWHAALGAYGKTLAEVAVLTFCFWLFKKTHSFVRKKDK